MRVRSLAAALSIALVLLPAAAAGASPFPVRTPPGDFASASMLRQMNGILARVGARPTGSPAQMRFLRWIGRNLRDIHGLRLSDQPYSIRRWSARSSSLQAEIDGVPHVSDLEEAAAAGAAGLVYFHELPRSQVEGHLAPYEGTVWGVPGIYLGVEEGTRLSDAILSGHATGARLTVDARIKRTSTKTLLRPGEDGAGAGAGWNLRGDDPFGGR